MHFSVTQLLEDEYSHTQSRRVAQLISKSEGKDRELIELVKGTDKELAKRAAWCMSHLMDLNHRHLDHFAETLITEFQTCTHEPVLRNISRALQHLKIPPETEGLLVSKAFDLFGNAQTSIAVKANCMIILDKACEREPELKNEFRLLIESQWEHSTAAFRSRGKKVLKKL